MSDSKSQKGTQRIYSLPVEVTDWKFDGATEIHKVTLARQLLSRYEPYDGLFPPYHLPEVRAQAEKKFAAQIAELQH